MSEPPRARTELDHDDASLDAEADALASARLERERIGFMWARHELVSALAHDLNQPLAAIVPNANAARRWLAFKPPDMFEASAAVQRIDGEGKRASQLVERVRRQLSI